MKKIITIISIILIALMFTGCSRRSATKSVRLDYIKENLDQINPGYGVDDHSKNAEKLIKEKLEDENVDIYFIHGGTGANILGASVGMLPQESIIAATSGHIEDQEAGAIEACGIKI